MTILDKYKNSNPLFSLIYIYLHLSYNISMAYTQHERFKVRRPCIAYLREMIALNQLKRYEALYFACPPDLGKLNAQQTKQAVLDGYQKGVFDLTIVCANKDEHKVFLIEFKYENGKYTTEQQATIDKFEGTPVVAMKIRTKDEFIEFVENSLK